MLTLINLAIKGNALQDWFSGDYSKLSQFLASHRIDGVEAILYNEGPLEDIPSDTVIGLHLIYWPMWLDLWLNDLDRLYKEFINSQNVVNYYGFNSSEGFIRKYTEEFEAAKILGCEYMVFHVSQISIEETYSRQFHYSDRQVLDETAALVNKVFKGSGPLLLFENLWSSGLNFLDYDLTKHFIESIDYENKGFMLDISHLLITNPAIETYAEAIDYIKKILDNLGDLKRYIKGIHLNKSCFSGYIRENHLNKSEVSIQTSDFIKKLIDVYDHISQIDTHAPFLHEQIKEIVDRLSPEYLVYEFMPESLIDWESKIESQNKFLKR
ncbi:MAG: TIM barrel protein [Clostridia bacterium]|nr:TIM barrel protein [Clostridia bacterium]